MEESKSNGRLEDDRISQLPDGVLSEILSLLPTRYAVQTTILSKRWKNLWVSVRNLDLVQGSLCFNNFAKLVEGVLSSSSNIQRLRLHCSIRGEEEEDGEDFSRVRGWICAAMIRHNIVELELDISYVRYYVPVHLLKEFQLPPTFFACKTLVILKVDSNCISLAPPPSASTCFPSLKSLYFKPYSPDDASVFEMLFPKCPVLEELTIDKGIVAKDGYNIKISAPGLKTLRIFDHSYSDHYIKYNYFIDAPKLENLVVSGNAGFSNYYFLDNAKSMVKAEIHSIHAANVYRIIPATPIVGGVSGVKCLSLATPSFLACSLPSFNNLKQLKVALFHCSYWGYAMELLKRSPNLEDIVLDINRSTWSKQSYVQRYWPVEPQPICFSPFNPPECVPTCVSLHLRTISINNFMGYDDEFEVVKYLLKYGEVLKKMIITTNDFLLYDCRRMTRDKLYKKSLKFQKCSKTCEVEVKVSNRLDRCNDFLPGWS